MKQKTQVEDVNRSLYDFRYGYDDQNYYKVDEGFNAEIIETISKEKK